MTWNDYARNRRVAFELMGLRTPATNLAFQFLSAPEPKIRRCRAPGPIAARDQRRGALRFVMPSRQCSACGSSDHDVRAHQNGRVGDSCNVCGEGDCVPSNHDRVDQLRARTASTDYSRVIPVSRLTRAELDLAQEPSPADMQRPTSRSECRGKYRPCPWISCRHHLYLDVNPETGSIKLNFPHLEPWEMKETCSLDVAERGQHTAKQVGKIMRLSKQRVSQIEERRYKALKGEFAEAMGEG